MCAQCEPWHIHFRFTQWHLGNKATCIAQPRGLQGGQQKGLTVPPYAPGFTGEFTHPLGIRRPGLGQGMHQ